MLLQGLFVFLEVLVTVPIAQFHPAAVQLPS
jgi:uncharacterized protein involved in propanediol utilization